MSHVNFEITSSFPSKLDQSSVSLNMTPLYIFSSNIAYFHQKKPVKVQILKTIKLCRRLKTATSFIKKLVSEKISFMLKKLDRT